MEYNLSNEVIDKIVETEKLCDEIKAENEM